MPGSRIHNQTRYMDGAAWHLLYTLRQGKRKPSLLDEREVAEVHLQVLAGNVAYTDAGGVHAS